MHAQSRALVAVTSVVVGRDETSSVVGGDVDVSVIYAALIR